LLKLGHDAPLISPQFVKPYVKGNKNDSNDAEAICEAVSRPSMRFVPVKSGEQQDSQALQRVHSGLVKARTARINRLRGLLGEYGIVIGQGLSQVRQRLPERLEDSENGLTMAARELFADLQQQLLERDKQISVYGEKIQAFYRASAVCKQIGAAPGIGPITATVRQVPAWLGLVPKQDSSGGKSKLLGISKRGDTYLRILLIHGAHSAANKDDV
jgi:transposase